MPGQFEGRVTLTAYMRTKYVIDIRNPLRGAGVLWGVVRR